MGNLRSVLPKTTPQKGGRRSRRATSRQVSQLPPMHRVSKRIPGSSSQPTTRKLRSATKSELRAMANLISAESPQGSHSIPNGSTTLIDSQVVIPPRELDDPANVMSETDKKFATLSAKEEAKKEVVKTGYFCYRKICILYDNDPEDREKETIRAMLDTGSGYTFIFKSELEKLGLRLPRGTDVQEFFSLTNDKFRAIGRRQIFFKYRNIQTQHSVNAFVLEDPGPDFRPSFDILLGRDHLIPTSALIGNPAVIGPTCFVEFRP